VAQDHPNEEQHMTNDELKQMHEALKQPMSGPLTLVSVMARLNEVLGIGGYRIHRSFEVMTAPEGKYTASGAVTIEIGTWQAGTFVTSAEILGDGTCTAPTEFMATLGGYEAAVVNAATLLGMVPRVMVAAPVVKLTPFERPTGAENLLTSRQMAALNGISRKLGHSPAAFAESVRSEFGVLPHQLSRSTASKLISRLEAALHQSSPRAG
jgi:hypothetical protein